MRGCGGGERLPLGPFKPHGPADPERPPPSTSHSSLDLNPRHLGGARVQSGAPIIASSWAPARGHPSLTPTVRGRRSRRRPRLHAGLCHASDSGGNEQSPSRGVFLVPPCCPMWDFRKAYLFEMHASSSQTPRWGRGGFRICNEPLSNQRAGQAMASSSPAPFASAQPKVNVLMIGYVIGSRHCRALSESTPLTRSRCCPPFNSSGRQIKQDGRVYHRLRPRHGA